MAYKEEELLLSAVLEKLAIEQFEKIQDHIEKNGAHTFSQNFEDKMNILFSRNANEFKAKQDHELVDVKEEINKGRKTILPGRYLLIAILIMLISSISVVAYGPIKQMLKKIEFFVGDEYIKFHLDNVENQKNDNITFFKPTYVPSGYELLEETIDETLQYVSVIWINEMGETAYYEQTTVDKGDILLSSDGQVPTDIQIDGTSAKLIEESDGFNTIFYEDEGMLFMGAGYVDKDELIKMLLNLEEIETSEEPLTIFRPTYVPDEFKLIDEHIAITGTSYSLMWVNKNEEVLSYTQTNNPNAMIHTSDGSEAIDITIGANTGKLTKQENGLISIFLEDKGCLFVVDGFIEKEELIRILLSIEPVEIKKEQ